MSSAALRSRTGRADGGGADDDASGPAPILDTDAQEALVNELEADARRQATVWRRVFGALSIAWGMYFVNSAAHAASGDVTIAWSGVRTAVASPSTSFATCPPTLRALSTRPSSSSSSSSSPSSSSSSVLRPRPRRRPFTHRDAPASPQIAGDTRGVLPPRSAHHVHRVVDAPGPLHSCVRRRRGRRRRRPRAGRSSSTRRRRQRLPRVNSRMEPTRQNSRIRGVDGAGRGGVRRVGVDHREGPLVAHSSSGHERERRRHGAGRL